MPVAILNDLTRCVGCRACVQACKEINGLPPDTGTGRLSASSWCAVEPRAGLNVKRQCMHCLDPACVSVCPVAALTKTAAGPVVYDEDRCMGCRYCMVACPFGVPTYEWNALVPRVQKCVMCAETRLARGLEPACTAACPAGATVFGDRDTLLREAERRIAAEPGRYVDHIFGQSEAGGTSVLYLSSVPFAQLGFPTAVNADPYPRLTWAVLSHLPHVVSIAGVTLLGIHWLTGRRAAVAAAEREETHRGHEPAAHESD